MSKWYAVRVGRNPGVYATWDECRQQVTGYSKAEYRSFSTRDQARAYVEANEKPEQSDTDELSPTWGCLYKHTSNLAVKVYTDGSCLNNGSHRARAGIGVYFGPSDTRNLSESVPGRQTNQRAELHAAIRALEITDPSIPLELHSDSNYLIKGMTVWSHKWRTTNRLTTGKLDNKELWIRLLGLSKGRTIKWIYVPAHSGIVGNEEADRLARLGATQS